MMSWFTALVYLWGEDLERNFLELTAQVICILDDFPTEKGETCHRELCYLFHSVS